MNILPMFICKKTSKIFIPPSVLLGLTWNQYCYIYNFISFKMTLQLHKHGIINIFKHVQNKKGLIFAMCSNGPLTPNRYLDSLFFHVDPLTRTVGIPHVAFLFICLFLVIWNRKEDPTVWPSEQWMIWELVQGQITCYPNMICGPSSLVVISRWNSILCIVCNVTSYLLHALCEIIGCVPKLLVLANSDDRVTSFYGAFKHSIVLVLACNWRLQSNLNFY